jgi:hypothetical protein
MTRNPLSSLLRSPHKSRHLNSSAHRNHASADIHYQEDTYINILGSKGIKTYWKYLSEMQQKTPASKLVEFRVG